MRRNGNRRVIRCLTGLICLIAVGGGAQLRADTAVAPAKRQVYYRLPAGFTAFKPVATVDLKISTNTVAGRVIEEQWYTPDVDRLLGKNGATGISYETTITGARVLFLLFNRSYPDEVLDGITMRQTKQEIVRELGAPQFEDRRLKVFGYKGKECYVFFAGDTALQGITVYRRDTGYARDPVRRYANGERFEEDGHYGLLWAASDKHYAAGMQRDEYISIGAKISWDLSSYITLYNNFEGEVADGISVPENYAALQAAARAQDKVPAGDEGSTTLAFEPDTDSVFAFERERLGRIADAARRGIRSPDRKKVLVYDGCSGGNAGFFVCFLDGSRPTLEQRTGSLNYYAWLNDRYIVLCRVDRSPLQIFDTVSQQTLLLEQEDDVNLSYKILSSGNGKLVYEAAAGQESSRVKYEQPYSFDTNGGIVLAKRRRLER